jgi:hypothetical protein
MMCRDYDYAPCQGDQLLGALQIEEGGTHVLRSAETVPLGIYTARLRFEPRPPFKARFDFPNQRIFIGIPPSQLMDDLLQ